MEQSLRLVPGTTPGREEKRTARRQSLAVPGQIVWKDARGTTRMASVDSRQTMKSALPIWRCLPRYFATIFPFGRSMWYSSKNVYVPGFGGLMTTDDLASGASTFS